MKHLDLSNMNVFVLHYPHYNGSILLISKSIHCISMAVLFECVMLKVSFIKVVENITRQQTISCITKFSRLFGSHGMDWFSDPKTLHF